MTTTAGIDPRPGARIPLKARRPPIRRSLWVHFLVNTPTIVATVDAALAAAMVVLGPQAADAPQGRGGGRRGGGVPAGLGDAVLAAGADPAPAPPPDTQIPHPAGPTLSIGWPRWQPRHCLNLRLPRGVVGLVGGFPDLLDRTGGLNSLRQEPGLRLLFLMQAIECAVGGQARGRVEWP